MQNAWAGDDYFTAGMTGKNQWGVAENWSIGALPTADDHAWLSSNDGIDHSVSVDVSANASTLSVGNTGGGTATLVMDSEIPVVTQQELIGFGIGGDGYVGNSRGAVVQNAGSNSTTVLFLAYYNGSSEPTQLSAGAYTLNAGTLVVSESFVLANGGAGTFTQNGGTALIHDMVISGRETSSGTYILAGGVLESDYQGIGETATGTFEQTGGRNSVYTLKVGVSGLNPDNAKTVYKLSGSQSELIAGFETVGGNSVGTFSQVGGFNQVTDTLYVGGYNRGTYSLGGGSLQVANAAYIGLTGQANFIASGGRFTVGSDLAYGVLNIAAYSFGTLTIDSNQSQVNVVGVENVGLGSRGTVNQSAGTHTITGSLLIGNHASAYALSGGTLSAADETIALGPPSQGIGSFVQTGGSNAVSGTLNVRGAGTYALQAGRLSAGTVALDPGSQFNWIGGSLSADSLSVLGTMTLSPGHDKTLAVKTLTLLNYFAKLDLADNSLVIDYTGAPPDPALRDIRTHLFNGDLVASSADAAHRIGYGDNALLHFSSFGDQSFSADHPTQVLAGLTFAGDANLDGKVDYADLQSLAADYSQSGVWTGGDFDYDGTVGYSDLQLLAKNWGAGTTNPGDLSADLSALGLPQVPEPHGLALLIASALLLRRRAA